jgi:DNA-binding transcriptional MerR regulator
MIQSPPIPDKEFFSIGEVASIVGLPAYVLRYWESEFKLLRPSRRTSGQRKYIKKDIEQIFKIKDLLHTRKFTIAGAKKQLIGDKRKKDTSQLNFEIQGGESLNPKILHEIQRELEEAMKLLK